jgi:ribonuclease BN (tRNA processing enzyme)
VRVSVAAQDPPLVYSGDVAAAADLAPLIRPGDVLLVECSFGPGPVPPGAAHLDGPAIAGLAIATKPGVILLTHILPGQGHAAAIASVRLGHDGPIRVVAPGAVIPL